jgi:hypothetical protein
MAAEGSSWTSTRWTQKIRNGSCSTELGRGGKHVWHWEGVEFIQHMNEERKPAVYVRLVMRQFEKFCVSANITWRKITQQVHKNLIWYSHIYTNISFKKQSQIIIYIAVKKRIHAACLFSLYSLKGLPGYGWNVNAPPASKRVNNKGYKFATIK